MHIPVREKPLTAKIAKLSQNTLRTSAALLCELREPLAIFAVKFFSSGQNN